MGSQLSPDNSRAVRQPGSIYYRLIIPLGITLLLAMLAAWVIAVQLLTNAIDRRLDDQLERATAILADGRLPFSPDLIDRLDRLIVARIVLLDEFGVVRLSSTNGPPTEALATLAQEMPDMNDDQPALLTNEAGGDAWRIAVQPISGTRDNRFHYVVAAASLAETRQAARNAAIWLGAAMLLATILLAWFGNFFTRSITGPVSDLANMADRIADGERDVSSDFTANNEIGLLARALNGMASRLTQYESELAHRSRMSGLGDLAARLAHEIRNPLTAIKMQLQMLEESVANKDAGRVKTLLVEIRRMELIVESALTLAAPLVLRRSMVQPATVIVELNELLQPALSHRKIELQTVVNPSRDICVDPDRLKQVLLNVINNAADELGDGGVIRVGTHSNEHNNSFEISVEDSGPGIRPDTEGSGRSKPFGLGLGLTICREIIEQHGGELVQGTSSELGGAQFTIRLQLPIINDPEQAG